MRSGRLRSGESVPSRLGSVLAAMALALAVFHGQAQAQECEPGGADTEGCLFQDGDNETGASAGFDGGGGDGVAGSNVIGAAGTGSSTIEARNDSRFSRSEGGDVEANSTTDVANGPRLEVAGGDRNVVAEATGVSTVTQVSVPNTQITLGQAGSATGAPNLSNTVASLVTLTGLNTLAAPTGAGPVTQTINQNLNAPVNNTFAPVISTIVANNATVTGSAPVVQLANVVSNPTATVTVGPGVSAAAVATGSATAAQSASPSFVAATGQSATATGSSVTNAVVAQTTLRAQNTIDAATGFGPVFQTITQTVDAPVTNVFTPVITTGATNAASQSGSSPVQQSAVTAITPTTNVGP